jgi:hypothetical protein
MLIGAINLSLKKSTTLSSTPALDASGWIMPRPGRFTPGKDPVPTVMRLCRPQGRSGRVRKISSPTGFAPRTVQPVGTELSRPMLCRVNNIKHIIQKCYTIFAQKTPARCAHYLTSVQYAQTAYKHTIILSYSVYSATCFG